MRGLMEPLILESLARGPKHGYALIKEVEAVFEVAPNKNQVYPLLARLESDGLIAGKVGKEARSKTEYSLTAKGRTLLDDYRRMPPEFLRIVEGLWGVAGPAAKGRTAEDLPPETRSAGGRAHDHLVVTLKTRPGSGRVEVAFENLETGEGACKECRAAAQLLAGLRKRFFDWQE